MPEYSSNLNEEPRLGKTLREDFRRGDLRRTVKREFRELKEFYIDEERRKRLAGMGVLRRWFSMSIWLLEALFLKLTPARRVLLLFGLVLVLMEFSVRSNKLNIQTDNLDILGGLTLLFVLMLELKDKLLARSELDAGRKVQYALMPEKTPNVPGWSLYLVTRPANEVSGDLVDFIQMTEDKFAVALADVTGKGLRAALLMAKLQATLRALVSDFDSLSEFGAKINNIFHRDSLPNIFASLVYMQIQPNSGLVRLLNAGHLPPIILRGTTIEEMPKGAPAIGLLPDAAFGEQSVDLKPGDVFVAYSDGLTEARNEVGEFFGHQRLSDLLPTLHERSAEEIGEGILKMVDSFVGEARANDDLSMVILKRIHSARENV